MSALLATRSPLTWSRGRSVTAFGVLFDFATGDVNTTIQRVEDMVQESWVRILPLLNSCPTLFQFAEAIADEPDVFLLVG
jgi:hypothetical protein